MRISKEITRYAPIRLCRKECSAGRAFFDQGSVDIGETSYPKGCGWAFPLRRRICAWRRRLLLGALATLRSSASQYSFRAYNALDVCFFRWPAIRCSRMAAHNDISLFPYAIRPFPATHFERSFISSVLFFVAPLRTSRIS